LKQRDDRTRRAALALPGFFMGLLLAACGAAPVPFHATEVTGIDYGRGVRIADTDGRMRALEDFRDRVTVVFFGFAGCPDVCPTTLLRLREARRAMAADGARVQVVLVTVDPERDTAERLRDYVRTFDPSFIALRPEPAALAAVLASFHALAVKVPLAGADPAQAPGDYSIDHSAVIYVYDRANRLRLIAQPDFRKEELAADLTRLARE
jgi:protein SCO1/2